jgi:hypothetical protein
LSESGFAGLKDLQDFPSGLQGKFRSQPLKLFKHFKPLKPYLQAPSLTYSSTISGCHPTDN